MTELKEFNQRLKDFEEKLIFENKIKEDKK